MTWSLKDWAMQSWWEHLHSQIVGELDDEGLSQVPSVKGSPGQILKAGPEQGEHWSCCLLNYFKWFSLKEANIKLKKRRTG